MIQGFAFPVSNFESVKNNTIPKANLGSTTNSFNSVLRSTNNELNQSSRSDQAEDNTLKEKDFISKQNEALRRRIEIRHEEPSDNSDTKTKLVEEKLTPKEETVKKVLDSLEGVVAVLQNALAISDVDLKDVDLDNLNLEVSVEELEHLKVSLESLTETLDMGEASEQLAMMIQSLGEMITSARENGEIQIEASEFALELDEMMQLIETELKSSGILESTELKSSITDMVETLDALDEKSNNVDLSDNFKAITDKLENLLVTLENTKDIDLNDTLRETIVDVLEVLQQLSTEVNEKGEVNAEKISDEDISVKLEQLMSTIKSQKANSETDNNTELKEVLSEVVEVMESLNTKTDKSKSSEAISDKLEQLSNTFLTKGRDIRTPDTDISDTSIKIKIVTEKNEGMNNKTIEVLDEAPQIVEKITTELLSPLENQIKAQTPTAVSVEKASVILNPQQFMDIDKSDIIKQITNKVKTDYENELNEIKLRLTPEHLGELTIKISLERGILSARALVENTNIKQLLESNMGDLKESLEEQGMKFGSIDVSVGKDSEFEEKTPNFFVSQKQNRRLKATIDNPAFENYYGELDEKNISSTLSVGEGTMDITV